MSATLPITQTELSLAPGRWTLDRAHSSLVFSIRHLGLARVHGRFDDFDATLAVAPTLVATRAEATVELSSVKTGQPDRDAHLRGTDFFSVERHPQMRFVSTDLTGADDRWTLTGDLTLNGRTHPLTLRVEVNGLQVHPQDQQRRLGVTATGSLRRSAFGIEFGLIPLGGEKLALGDEVKFEIDLQFIEPTQAGA